MNSEIDNPAPPQPPPRESAPVGDPKPADKPGRLAALFRSLFNDPAKVPEDRHAIRFLQAVNTLYARVYHNLTVLAPSQVPRVGPALVVCNHISSIDPLLLQSACTYRLVQWMMAKEYTAIPYMGRIFQTLEVIPVDRGSREKAPLRTALRRLADGRVVGIFPEGTFSTTGELLEFQTGVALIAIKAKVPVYPAYLDGTERNKGMVQAFQERSRSVISFGPAVEFNRADTTRRTLEAATAAIQTAVRQLRPAVDEHRKFW
jgi:1-acyl-sn-glycerol-3-phosphate acyltransferase